MEFCDVIARRRTIRDFTGESIPDEVIERVIRAGLRAPTNDHLRDWHYIVVKDKETVVKLLDIIPKGITEEELKRLFKAWSLNDSEQQNCYRDAVPKQHRMLLDAGAVIIPLLRQKTNILHPDNLSHLNGFASIWCSIENIFLAATNEGYGCTLRIPLGREDEWAKDVLGFPDDYFMPCFIGIGKPAENAAVIKQKSINVNERIHWDKW